MKLIHSLGLITVLSTACIQGSGHIITESYTIESFKNIDLEGLGTIYFTPEASDTLRIVTDDNIMEYIRYSSSGDTLKIWKERNIHPTELTFYVGSEHLKEIEISGSVDLFSTDVIEVPELHLDISGSADVDLDVVTQKMEISISGSSDITMFGSALEQKLSVSGSTDANLLEFRTKSTTLNVSGSADCKLWVEEILEIDISGSGDITLKGDPQILSDVSGSVDIHYTN